MDDKILHQDAVEEVIRDVMAENPSGGGGLRTPDQSAGGYLGGFGVDLTAQKDGPVAGFVTWDEVYALDAGAAPADVAIDNSYMLWDPAHLNRVKVKQAGWYNLLISVNFNAALTTIGHLTVGGPLQAISQDIPVGGGTDLNLSMLAWIDADINVILSLTGDTDLAYAALGLIPLFALS
jgi:hypothetical protein